MQWSGVDVWQWRQCVGGNAIWRLLRTIIKISTHS